MRTVLDGPRPHGRLPAAGQRALPRGDRPRHVRAARARRRGLGRHPDLAGRARVDGAADGLRAGQGPRPRARRRRHRLDDEPRHRRRGGREVHRGRQPARALRQRLHARDPDAAGHEGPARLGHGLPEDRLPDVQAARLPAPARDGAPVAGALPRRRHRADRARGRRRADVPDEHPQLHVAARGRPPRLPVRHGQARLGLRGPARGRAAPRHRDLRDARAQGHAALRRRRRRSRAPGAGSSSRRRARCCASRRPTDAAADREARFSPRRGRRTGPRTSR